MRGEPPENLVRLLARLKIATVAEVRAVAPRVRRLAGDLPDFESVWVDGLAQARVLTPYQAAQINAGRGETLLCGPYLISERASDVHYAACFAARHFESGRVVRLYVVAHPQVSAAQASRTLAHRVEHLAPLRGPSLCVPDDSGLCGEKIWATCPAFEGTSAAQWMSENGRFPPQSVLQIAREMLARLADLERLGVAHGDVGAAGLFIQPSGHVLLPMPALRGVVRPSEGYSFNDLPPEAYDYLAPERIAEGTPPTIASDAYACGCLWWHLLTGRPPFSGGNSLARLKAAHAAKVVDVRQLAPEVPDNLAHAIQLCLTRSSGDRPRSLAALMDILGPATRSGAASVARCLNQQSRPWQTTRRGRARPKSTPQRLLRAAGAVTVAMLILVGMAPVWRAAQTSRARLTAAAKTSSKPSTTVRPSEDLPSENRPQANRAIAQFDPHVVPATAIAPAVSDAPADLVLSNDKQLQATELKFKPGQHVRGRAGKRPLVSIGGQGLTVDCEDVCFEGIDFVWEADADGNPNRAAAMMIVAAQSLELRGCSFSSREENAPVAIAWTGGAAGPSRELVATDCVFSGVQAILDCQAAGGLTVELSNSLCVASGPIVRLHRCPKTVEAVTILLDHTTTRGDCAVLECRYARLEAQPGPIAITATDSALDTNPHGGLLVFSGSQRPDPLLGAITWMGQGSLVTPATAVALWRKGADSEQELAEEELEVAGLVRSQVEFAGRAEGPPSASRITRWQVPLRSADPPGANANSLHLPRP